jgi:hypothetical protein
VIDAVNICRLPLPWETDEIDDHMGFDEHLTYDGRQLPVSVNIPGEEQFTIQELPEDPGSGYNAGTTLLVTCYSPCDTFSDTGLIGRHMRFYGNDGESVTVEITAIRNDNAAECTPTDSSVPQSLRNVPTTVYALCASTVSGLDHVNGETVGIIADGSVEPQQTVSGGVVTLSRPFVRVQVGLPVVADAQTLDLEVSDTDSVMGDARQITKVFARVDKSRGLEIGYDEATLEPMSNLYTDLTNAAPAVQSGVVEFIMRSTHSDTGSVLFRQAKGLPATILGARPIFNRSGDR